MRIRLRPRRMSLAAKSQLLFGLAALLIISCALFVQFQRMEQLTRQLDVSAGRAVIDVEIARHILSPESFDLSTAQDAESPSAFPVRLLKIERVATLPDDAFERQALDRFVRRVDREYFSRTTPGPDGPILRFAAPMRLGASCISCHAAPQATPVSLQNASTQISSIIAAASTDATTITDDPASTVNGNTQASTEETRSEETNASQATTTEDDADGPAPGELFGIAVVELPSQISAQQRVLNHVFLLAAGLLAGLTAIVALSFIITRLILRPVRVLQDTAEKVGEGDLNVRVKITSGDEFEHLASTFNRMLRNLQQSTEQLSAANRSLDLQIVKLNESNSALAEGNRLKSEFLASVSHELRTPLNSILGFAELLRSGGLPEDARTTRYLQNIITGGHNLLDLINDLLDLAKIEAGRADIRVIAFSLSDLFEALCGLLKPLAEKRKLHIRVTVSPDVPIIQSDSAKLQQVLYNLLSNAIKFSPDGSVIDLLATRVADDMVQISVVDRGPGIAPEHHNTIFEKFRQLDQGVTRTHGGTGLGLSISRELVRLLGGTLAVESQLGQGATFRVNLPLSIESGLRETRPLSIGG